jgi:hypothetical protein
VSVHTVSIIRLRLPEGSKVVNALAIHLHRDEIDEELIDNLITRNISSGVAIQRVYIIGHESILRMTIDSIGRKDAVLSNRLKRMTLDDKGVFFLTFSFSKGCHILMDGQGDELANSQDVIEKLRNHILHELFHRTNGLIKSPKGFHYVKPSGKHVTEFLRTSNVFEDPCASNELCFWLFPYVFNKNVDSISVDTTGIAVVATELAYQYCLYGKKGAVPVVHSFGSYEGLESRRTRLDQDTLYLISASTSGSLEEKMVRCGASRDHVITLFYLGSKDDSARNVLCDLGSVTTSKTRYQEIAQYESRDCPYCAELSFPVQLAGDQFSPEPPRVEPILIKLNDLDKTQKDLIDKYSGFGIFKVFRNIGGRDAEFFIDIEPIFQTSDRAPDGLANASEAKLPDTIERLKQRIAALMKRGAPIHLERIVHTNYPYSKQLAEIAAELLAHGLKRTPDILTASKLREHPEGRGTATLVVTSCLADAHEIMGINRDLRTVQPAGNTTYIATFFRNTSAAERGAVKSSISFGEHGPDTFNLYTIVELDLPECSPVNSWKFELNTLRRVVEWSELQNLDVPCEIAERIAFLESAPRNGLFERLFWDSPKGHALRVRPDFTLIDVFSGAREISQADVYFAIAAVLHSLRNGISGRRLTYRSHERSVISPENFSRFNDAVIQSAILRAARDRELGYKNCDKELSRNMADIIIAQASVSRGSDGDGLPEFLLALATGRMTLHDDHLAEVCSAVERSMVATDSCKTIAKYIEDN